MESKVKHIESNTGLLPNEIQQLKGIFAEYPQIEQVVLYGSRAKGNFRNNSDIDLTIKGDVSIKTLFEIENELDDLLLPYKIDLSIFNTIDNQDLIEHINRVGQVFYEK